MFINHRHAATDPAQTEGGGGGGGRGAGELKKLMRYKTSVAVVTRQCWYTACQCLKPTTRSHAFSPSLCAMWVCVCVCVCVRERERRERVWGGPRVGLLIEKCGALTGTHDWAIQFDLVKITTLQPCLAYQSHVCQRTQISSGWESACVRN